VTDAGPRLLELQVGPPGHGGFCVARAEGRVVFVRHALPGERVRAVVTEDDGGRYCRADAIEVLAPAPERVRPPCPHAGPGRCGGCDWQHASGPAQRALKAAVVREQFARLAGLDLDLAAVEELPGGLLGWRTRIGWAVSADGTVGLHRHRSHEIEPVRQCPLGRAAVAAAPSPPAGATGVETVAGPGSELTVITRRPGAGRQARGRRPPDRTEVVAGPDRVRHELQARAFEVSATGFWQVHPAALPTFAAAIVAALAPRPGETALDLYAGAGPLTAVLGEAVGPSGRVVGIESSRAAVADAEKNLADLHQAEVRWGRVDARLLRSLDLQPDLVVLDPPRAGLGAAAVEALLALGPRRVAYLSCDPATLARDVAVATGAGWHLAQLRAFDAFPMTRHVECLAVLQPGTPAERDPRHAGDSAEWSSTRRMNVTVG
jgi:tRNA/tmRNA/rRNA uracil-C5-methylase (TrmA/RlmC/RlmD family)